MAAATSKEGNAQKLSQKIKYDSTLMKLMPFFETLTKARLKDCFVDNNGLLVFVVEPAQLGLAIGKNGSNVKRLEATLKRKIKVVEFSDEVASFVASLIQPIKAKSIEFADDVITIIPDSGIGRGYIIGRGGRNLRNYESIIKRYFHVKEVRVV